MGKLSKIGSVCLAGILLTAMFGSPAAMALPGREEVAESGFEKILPVQDCEYSGKAERTDEGLVIQGDAEILWDFSLKESGSCKLALGYVYTDDGIVTAEAEVTVNGGTALDARRFTLNKWWENADGEFPKDQQGNDMRKGSTVYHETCETTLFDEEGINDALDFSFDSGENSVRVRLSADNVVLQYLRLYREEEKNYASYISHAPNGRVSGEPLVVEAEMFTYKSDSMINVLADRADFRTTPNDPAKLRYNALSGSTFKSPGQEVVIKFQVPESGRYRIGFRYRQNSLPGYFVTKMIRIDGECLFEELRGCRFAYSDDFAYQVLGNDDTPEGFLFYLEAGEHTISITNVSGESGWIIQELQKCILGLNNLYRQIIMVTGNTPDLYRDYLLDKEIDGLIPSLETYADRLDQVADRMSTLSGQKGGQSSLIRQLSYMLESFVKKPAEIPARLDTFKSNISSVSTLMLALQEQPMDLDSIILTAPERKYKSRGSWLNQLVFSLQSFFASFVNDYTSIGAGESEAADTTITAWFSGGREQAEIVKRMINESFTPRHGIGVNVELVSIPLNQSILAGISPDVVLGISRGQPVNLGARGALLDLGQFPDLKSQTENFLHGALTPYTYNGKVYGLPVTIDFHMMFYRKDVLDSLELEIPQTWEEFYRVLMILQRNNMEVGLPYAVITAQGSIDGGMGAKDIFPTLVLQSGETVYNQELTATNLENPTVMEAFRRWTELYTEYKLPLTYDFYNRFRTGEMPLGIQSYGMYNMLISAAPEIRGLWDMTLIPGTPDDNGGINRAEAASGTATVIPAATQYKEEAWELLKWWVSEDTQAQYGLEQEILLGASGRYGTANLRAMERLPWEDAQIAKLQEQMSFIQEIPELVGGYYTTRGVDNAFRSVVLLGDNYRNTLSEENISINKELERKRLEIQRIQNKT